jgi:uncharacterized NAD(P)/FAD-binding protein YdhS
VTAQLTDPEDTKLVVLARAARVRGASAQGAAVRDTDGRTYTATGVTLPSLQLSAVQLAVATAATSGVSGLEAVVVVGGELADDDRVVVSDFAGRGVPIYLVSTTGELVGDFTT